MYRATTPTHTFQLPIETSSCSEILVSYRQGSVALDKHYQDNTLPDGMTLVGKNIVIILTQKETNSVKEGTVKVQIRVLTNSGAVMASQIFKLFVADVINEEVLQ